MRSVLFAAAATCALTVAAASSVPALADAKPVFFNKTIDKVFEDAAKSGKGVLVVCGANVFGTSLTPQPQFDRAMGARPKMTPDLDAFERAYANCFSKPHMSNQCVNPMLEKAYGWPIAVCAYAPGGIKPLWHKQLVRQNVQNPEPELTDDTIAGAVKEAREALDAFKNDLAAVAARYEAKDIGDKKLRQSADAQIELAEAYAKGCVLEPALTALTGAAALLKKDKDNPDREARIEALALRRGEIAAACGGHARAALEYGEFVKKYRKSQKLNEARLAQATALVEAGDKQANEVVRGILADKSAADIHGKARELQSRLGIK